MRTTLAATIGAVMMCIPAVPAGAVASLGASTNCDGDRHCVAGSVASGNVGAGGAGAIGAVCNGTGPGAGQIVITCTVTTADGSEIEETMSFRGSAGAVPVVTSETGDEPRLACWKVTGVFPTLLLAPSHYVTTTGCASIAL